MAWRIGEILVQKKLISWEQLQDALEEQKKTKELTGEILLRKKFIAPLLLYKALAEQYNMRFVDLKRTRINAKAVALIPKNIATQYHLIPIELSNDTLVVGIGNPINIWPEQEIKQLAKVSQIRTVLCLPEDIKQALEENYPHQLNRP
jgi:hypothetical protein